MLSADQLLRYSRQYIISEIGARGQKELLQGSVLVIGAGALGSPALMYLASAGVGTIAIADFDTVDLSNLQRQIIHDTESVGKKKTTSAKESINRLNPDVNVVLYEEKVTADNIIEIISGYDIIIDASDRLVTKMMINDACHMAGKPFVHAGAERFYGQVTTIIPGESPCLRCLFGDETDDVEEGACARYGILGPVTGVLGSLQAIEAIKYITGIGELLTGRVLYFDGLSMEMDVMDYEHNHACLCCSDNAPEDRLAEYREAAGCITCGA